MIEIWSLGRYGCSILNKLSVFEHVLLKFVSREMMPITLITDSRIKERTLLQAGLSCRYLKAWVSSNKEIQISTPNAKQPQILQAIATPHLQPISRMILLQRTP
jgi:hypothetical protein